MHLNDGHKLVETHPSVYIEAVEDDVHLPHRIENQTLAGRFNGLPLLASR